MTNAERRVNYVARVVDPPGEARSDLDIFIDFARRMHFTDRDEHPLLQFTTPEEAFNEWRRISKDMIPDYSGMTYAMIRDRGGVQWPCNEKAPNGTIRLYTDHQFPSNWEIAESYEKDLKTGHEHTLREYRETVDPRGKAFLLAGDYERPVEDVDEEFPLVAVAGRQVYHWHTRTKTAKAPLLADAAPRAFIAVSVADAARLSIRDGDQVRVISRRGSVMAPAKVGDVVGPGMIFMPFHFGELEGTTATNDLMPKYWDPVSKQPIQKMAAVRLERGEGPPDPWWQRDEENSGGAS
jgi:predicted molibdopterin-dependent oxidoreductase YjgC